MLIALLQNSVLLSPHCVMIVCVRVRVRAKFDSGGGLVGFRLCVRIKIAHTLQATVRTICYDMTTTAVAVAVAVLMMTVREHIDNARSMHVMSIVISINSISAHHTLIYLFIIGAHKEPDR